MSDAQTDFALRLLQQVGGDNNSVFFSPFSISAALAMTEAGASGATKTQLQEKVFGGKHLNISFLNLLRHYNC